MILMNKNIETLWFDDDYTTLKVLDNDFLPYMLKDYVKDSDSVTFKQAIAYMNVLKDFLVCRSLQLSNDNAKAILASGGFSQSAKISERLKIVEFSRGVMVTDNFWIKKDNENILFSDVNLREICLSDIIFDIAVLGKILPIPREYIIPALSIKGMFPKTFMKKNEELFFIKTDRFTDNTATKAELQVSDILKQSNVRHISYEPYIQNDILLAKCTCICNDKYSLVDAQSVKDWCIHTNQDFLLYVEQNFGEDFAKMCVIDYLLANTDRHMENWGFMVDNTTNEIIQMAPLFDHNQALIADIMNTDIDDLPYPPTNCEMRASAIKYFSKAHLEIDKRLLTQKALSRLDILISNR